MLLAYHRLDLAAIYTPKNNEKRKLKSEFVFSLFNAYSRKNPYFIYFNQRNNPVDGSQTVQAQKVSIFPIIPSVTWNFKL